MGCPFLVARFEFGHGCPQHVAGPDHGMAKEPPFHGVPSVTVGLVVVVEGHVASLVIVRCQESPAQVFPQVAVVGGWHEVLDIVTACGKHVGAEMHVGDDGEAQTTHIEGMHVTAGIGQDSLGGQFTGLGVVGVHVVASLVVYVHHGSVGVSMTMPQQRRQRQILPSLFERS